MEQYNSGVNTECKCKKNVIPLILITIALLGCMAVMIFLALQVKDGVGEMDVIGTKLHYIENELRGIENNTTTTDDDQFYKSFVIDKITFSAGPTSYTILQTTSTKTYTAYFYDAGYVIVTYTEGGIVKERYTIPLSSIYYIYE